ncbi:TPA: hypothetical protein EYP26_04485 [Candidatus Bathyarchaeota archaeon]|nr:hypothetical protein [Candidatus Bathyarchaeota archaeon]
MVLKRIGEYIHTPIRTIKVVVDIEDIFKPPLPIESFVKIYGAAPEPPRYRVISIEVVTCVEDKAPVLVTECGGCPKFVRRYKGYVCCRRNLV